MKLEIMPFATERAEDLLGFLKQSWLDTYIGEVGRNATNGLIKSVLGDGLDALIPGNDEEACLGVIGSQIVGSIICAYRNGYLYVWGLYVGRQHQRRGIGRAMLCHVMADRHEDVIVRGQRFARQRKGQDASMTSSVSGRSRKKAMKWAPAIRSPRSYCRHRFPP